MPRSVAGHNPFGCATLHIGMIFKIWLAFSCMDRAKQGVGVLPCPQNLPFSLPYSLLSLFLFFCIYIWLQPYNLEFENYFGYPAVLHISYEYKFLFVSFAYIILDISLNTLIDANDNSCQIPTIFKH